MSKLKEISEEQVEFISTGGRCGYSIRKVVVEVDNSTVDWWKVIYWGGSGIGNCGLVAHAPTKDLAVEQARRLINGSHTHLVLRLTEKQNVLSRRREDV